jgi:hypothetical protein
MFTLTIFFIALKVYIEFVLIYRPHPVYFLGRLECVGHSYAYVAHFVFLRDVWIRTQRAAVASRRATNLATHLPNKDDS